MTQFTCKGVKQIHQISLNMTFTFTIRISLGFSSALEFQMGNFQKYWGQDFIVLDFFVGGRLCGRLMSPTHETQSMWEIRLLRGRVNRYDIAMRGGCGRDRMVVGFTTYLCNQCLSPLTLWVRSRAGRCVQHFVIKFVGAFIPGPPVSSTN
jgi:hypothetical protein